jgi:hypothetical protein
MIQSSWGALAGTALFAILLTSGISHAEEATIKVKKAAWGMGQDIDVTTDVGRLCDGLRSCSFQVSPGNLGGKSPPNPVAHSLRVTYTCGKVGKNAEAMDFANIELFCD